MIIDWTSAAVGVLLGGSLVTIIYVLSTWRKKKSPNFVGIKKEILESHNKLKEANQTLMKLYKAFEDIDG